jgi:hypothetical protein
VQDEIPPKSWMENKCKKYCYGTGKVSTFYFISFYAVLRIESIASCMLASHN